jgi:anti-sigma regulatory factor (Ser/Thr protein kinase)
MQRTARGPGALHLQLANELHELARLHEAAEEFARRAGMPERRRLDLRLALEEVVANVIRYAWDGGRHRIDVLLAHAGGELAAQVADDGRPFNPLERPPLDPETPLEDRPVGGMGIHTVRHVTDGMAYERQGGRNVLSLTFRWRPDASRPPADS